jgi:hypothetical protein
MLDSKSPIQTIDFSITSRKTSNLASFAIADLRIIAIADPGTFHQSSCHSERLAALFFSDPGFGSRG